MVRKTAAGKLVKPSAQALKNSELHYRRLFEAAQDGILILDAQTGMIDDVNPSLIKMLGYSREEFVQKKLWEVGVFRDIQASKDAFKDLQANEYTRYEDLPLIAKDGRVIQVEFVSNVYLVGDEKVIQCDIRDITERRRIITALETNEKMYHDLINQSPDGYFIIELSGHILTVNKAICKELEFSEEELLSMSIWDIVPGRFLDQYRERLTKILKGESLQEAAEYEVRGKNGKTHYVEVISAPRYSGRDIIGFQGIARDITARKRAEEMLRESEERFANAFKYSAIGMAMVSPEGELLKVNSRVCSILGYSEDELLLKTFQEITHPDDLDIDLNYVRQMLAGEIETYTMEKRYFHRKGNIVCVFLAVALVRDSVGAPLYFVSQIEDITERKQTEEALRESEERLHAVLNSAPITIFATDKKGVFTVHEGRGLQRVGMKPGENVGTSAFELFRSLPVIEPTGKVTTGEDIIHRVLGGEIVTGITELKDMYFDNHFAPLLDTEGQVVGLVGVATDITERKQAEAAVRESQQRFSQVWEATSDAMALSDPHGIVLAANPAYLDLYGYKLEQVVGRSFAVIFPEEIQAQAVEQYKTVFASEVIPATFESAIRRADGSERIVESTVAFLTAAEQRIAMLSTIRDITARKQAEVALRESESKFRTLVAHLPIVVYMNPVGDATSTLYISPQIEKLAGYSPKEWLADPKLWLRSLHSDDRQHVLEQTAKTIQSGAPFELDYRLTARDGSLVWVHDQLVIVNDAEGRPQYWQGIMIDITERKQAEEMIRRQVDYLTALQDIDRTIASDVNMQLSLNALIVKARSLLTVDAAAVLLIDYSMNAFEFAAADGFRTNIAEGSTIRMERTYAGRVAVKHRMVKIPNLKEEAENLFLTSRLKGEDFVSYHGLPLIIKGKVIGVLEVFQRSLIKRDQEWLDFLNALAGQAAVAISNAQLFENLQQSNSELVQAYDATIEGWSRALDLRDKETEGHSQRVTEMTVRLARTFGLSEAELEQVRWGSLLHDIGKMGVPDGILLKPGALTDEEWIVMRKHPTFAFEMLSPIRFLRLALDIPYCHHEKWDGTGYPRGLKGDQIPLTARIFAIVDVWDALTSERSYRAAWTEEEAEIYIQNSSGTFFDPKAVDIFMQVIGRRSMTP